MSLTDHPRAAVSITVDGINLDQAIRPRLIRLTHTDNRGFEADQVEIELDDSDGALALPGRGAVLTLALGWLAEGLVDKGSYTVDEVEHSGTPDVLIIRANSADLRAGLTTQRERSWHDTTLGAIVSTIAHENDLQPAIHPALASLAVDHIDQTNESGANFLTRLAGLHDAIATVKSGRLLFIPTGAAESASGQPLPAVTITRQSGDRHRFHLADRQTYTAVRANYNDVNRAVKGFVVWGKDEDSAERGKPTPAPKPSTGQYKAIPGEFSSRDKARRAAMKAWKALKTNPVQRAAYIGTKATYRDKNLGSSGEASYGQADEQAKLASARKAAERDADKLSQQTDLPSPLTASADNLKTLRHVYASKANAERAARAEWRRLQRGMATFSITPARAVPALFPEIPVTLAGWKPQIDSTDWIITRVTNSLEGEGGYGQVVELEIRAIELPN